MKDLSVAASSERLSRTLSLSDVPTRLRYVSGKRAEVLENLGIFSVRDLFLHVPRRYLDFSDVREIGLCDVGSEATVIGKVDKVRLKRPRPRMQMVELSVLDGTGVMMAVFFRQPWVAEQVHEGDTIALSGKVEFFNGFKQMNSPFYEVLGDSEHEANHARILPVHPASEGISASWMRRIISAALADAGGVSDYLPADIISNLGLVSRGRAFRQIHFPSSMEAAESARRRLAFDELFCLQLALRTRQKVQLAGVEPHEHVTDGPHVFALREALPFALTDEQEACVADILSEMASPHVMNRLLLGDVGTGKTAVAAFGLASAADSNSQAAMMAPTSVLATQYAESLGPLLDAAGVSWTLIVGATPQDERQDAVARIATGEISVVFGTTALLSDDVQFNNLSLVVVDEQHRFGVDQRGALSRKGAGADMLAMSATPIPRTLALSIYGDMTSSRITKRPRAGAGITTHLIAPESLDLAYGSIRDAVRAGQQAYVVCPLIDDSDAGEDLTEDIPSEDEAQSNVHSAVAAQEELQMHVFRDMRVGLLTGRMSASEKDETMAKFRVGEIDVLVSTTVIEVGVDVPNATVMLVYDADRFGLATLHQLRGRVGRGDIAGDVWLMSTAKEESTARKRLSALEQTSDGMELAELDLELRHEGEVLGYRQHGGVSLKLVDLARDADIIEAAHSLAQKTSDADPSLGGDENRALAIEVHDRFGDYFEGGTRS